jgi:hypothetical protein
MQLNRLDFAALSILFVSAVAVGWPIWTGGYLTYMDNPVHIAEIHALASGEQWSDIGFCGFPLDYLHSPIWYDGLSVLVLWGVPAGPLFAAFLLLASLCPSVAVYVVGRRYLPPLAALVPAWLLLVQRTAIVGYGSVFGGMATFYIACGLLILFINLLANVDRSWRQVRYITFCLALLALTHLYALVAAVLVAALHSARLLLARPTGWQVTLKRDSVAYALATLCSSLYWYPMVRGLVTAVLAGNPTGSLGAENKDPGWLLMRLLVPSDAVYGIQTDLYLIDALPLIGLVTLGVIGMSRLSRWPNTTSLYGALLALGLGVLLFVLLPTQWRPWLGPNSWRFLFVLRIGLALAALPVLLSVGRHVFARRNQAIAVFGGVALIASIGFGAPLRSQVGQPEGPAWDDIQELWTWLKSHNGTSGRVFIQDTFMTEPRDHPFVRSHVLALTAHESGVPQIGPYYSIVPYKTLGVANGEVGEVLGLPVGRENHEGYPLEWRLAELQRRLEVTNTTKLVVADPADTEVLVEEGIAEVIWRRGRYTVLSVNQENSGWVSADGAEVRVKQWSPGRVVFDVNSASGGTTVLVKQSYHPGWTVSPGVTISESKDGLLELSVENQSQSNITLVWKPYSEQMWTSGFGFVVLLVWFLVGFRGPAEQSRRQDPEPAV